ncbi:hypothetical protein [Streptomyces griseorubiginosus]|uniref:hypothetical protein n=1 Tax=Streptomyces griseorubiginosus TaxID=67304 RepID=UPI0036E3872A
MAAPASSACTSARLLGLYGSARDFGQELAEEVVGPTEGTTASFATPSTNSSPTGTRRPAACSACAACPRA